MRFGLKCSGKWFCPLNITQLPDGFRLKNYSFCISSTVTFKIFIHWVLFLNIIIIYNVSIICN